MSLGASDGVRTVSITWMSPLLVATSAIVTVASLTITESPTVKANVWPFAAVVVIQLLSAVDGTSPNTTW